MSDSVSTTITTEGNTVTIQGAGFEHKVTVNADETIAAALERNGIDAAKLGVDLLVGGVRRDATEVTGSEVAEGSTLAAPPKQASLGSNAGLFGIGLWLL